MNRLMRTLLIGVATLGAICTLAPARAAEMSVMDVPNSACTAIAPYCRSFGRTILTCREARDLRKRGYPMESIQAASMIAAQTGESVDFLLRQAYIVGKTWRQVAFDRGLNWNNMRDSVYDAGPACCLLRESVSRMSGGSVG